MRELQLRTDAVDYMDVVWVRSTRQPLGGFRETLHLQDDSLPGDIVTLRWAVDGALHTAELPDGTTDSDLREIGVLKSSNGHYSFSPKVKTSMTYALINGVMRGAIAFYEGVRVPLPDLPESREPAPYSTPPVAYSAAPSRPPSARSIN